MAPRISARHPRTLPSRDVLRASADTDWFIEYLDALPGEAPGCSVGGVPGLASDRDAADVSFLSGEKTLTLELAKHGNAPACCPIEFFQSNRHKARKREPSQVNFFETPAWKRRTSL